jgi:hypothetical protein
LSTFERVATLPLEIEGYEIERREQDVSSSFTRVTTTVVLRGAGSEGRGEDVGYTAADHDHYPRVDIGGRWTLEELSGRLGELDLFPTPPARSADRDYRRWAFESAALDLGLNQADTSLGEVLGRAYQAVRFVVSTRLDIEGWLVLDPDLEFKLDPTSEWDRTLMERIAATGAVRVVDLKAYYEQTAVDQLPDPTLYANVVEIFPDAVIEDAALTDETREALNGAEHRLSWDAPVHSVADVEALPIPPRWLNIKPSRFGSVLKLFDCLDYCGERGIQTYGGGQFELGAGRGQIQALASLFYPAAPNDVAPSGYNAPEPRAGLPRSPLEPPADPVGFSFGPL